ncbi:MAG: hypothetical protein CM1200mP10_16590 [Candidatus Neomarinimicrobiota bacterium]|nr:MAG: hypothetical protein CM1200mP10_16590 [Candidatus Neomarinimicrobiota bacterium]
MSGLNLSLLNLLCLPGHYRNLNGAPLSRVCLCDAPSLYGRHRWILQGLGISKGGTGAVSMAIARSAQHFGADIMTEAPVKKVIVKNGKAVGVALENGDEYNRILLYPGLIQNSHF